MKELFAYAFIIAAGFIVPFITALIIGGIADIFLDVQTLHNALIYGGYSLIVTITLLALDYVQVHYEEH